MAGKETNMEMTYGNIEKIPERGQTDTDSNHSQVAIIHKPLYS